MARASKIAAWSAGSIVLLIAILVAVLAAFDWNRVKPWINNRVSEATGRPFAINGDLSLTWHAPEGETGWRAWIPWPRLNARDVVFGNPEWAKHAQMAEAEQVTVSISPLPLLQKRIAIASLALDAPRVALERQKDGRNNWTFQSDSEKKSEWTLDVQQLVLNKGTLQLEDAIKRANLKADIDTLGQGNGDYRIGWRVGGTLNGEQVTGNGRAGAVLSLQKKHTDFPIDADLRVGKTAVSVSGILTDPRNLAALDLKLKVSGVSMAHLYPLTGVVLPETRPFSTEGRLIGKPGAAGGDWTYEKFSGKMGGSDLRGSLRYQAREPRPLLEGTVVSNYLSFVDLAPLIGADSAKSREERGVKTVQPENKVLPVEKFKTDRWTSIDTDVQFTGNKIVRKEELPINNLVTRVKLDDGVLSLAPLKFGVAGGSLVSTIRLDGKSNPVKAEMKLSARHLKLKDLFPTLDVMRTSLGEINGDAALTASGDSPAALLGASTGEIRAVINQGTISKFVLEAMGLNIGSVVVTQLFGDKQVQLNCAVADFEVKKGVMQSRAFVVDTEDATIYVNGNINLEQEKLALTVLPESKGVRLISLRAPLYVNGPFKKPDVEVDKGVLAAKAGSAIALGALAPVAAALLPLVNVGPGEKSECGTLLAQFSEKPAVTAGKNQNNTSGK
ncbi:MAG TPA: AsmA family protein [Noviherbaspirillum sp.]|uniref:AsmA family protein n=1 Tax=Noviherbaspirillum sp. TaxID=1926288 RepID=UPI002D697DF4|nr:AsmA family protein [Noviherbaspirillum sp.]HYD96949.1 AsmA family protein [Noviherbaspirillum sp.]